jgi:RimJ/RimL family protein N-acetyltransferase
VLINTPETGFELRGVEEFDAEFLFKWGSHPEITRHTLGRRFPVQLSAIREWLTNTNRAEFPSRLAYIVQHQNPIGLVQLDQVDWVAKNAWLGIWIIPDARRAGYGSLALERLIGLATEHFGMRQVRLVVRKDNRAAIALYRKFGFQSEGELVDAEYREGALQSLVIMRRDL